MHLKIKKTTLSLITIISVLLASHFAYASSTTKDLYLCDYNEDHTMVCAYTNGICENTDGEQVACPAYINFEKIPTVVETLSLPSRTIYSCDYMTEDVMVCAYTDDTCEDLEGNMIQCPPNLLRM